ncbi:RING-type domain-containing protein [Caenorhabditis elegans]|nr:RING-type domain-containing protein [Caenorhabditis elegans]CDK13597.1 RING-type domain-containing protein [Caenorhabditis elegans]|eukprot:NP_001293830.1 Uncharacterized protein CELE_F42C5.4 [Caenorhabditis elegans]
MLHFVSLVCSGCDSLGDRDRFFDNDKKRPCVSSCNHSLCSQCFDKFTECPICKEPLVRSENYQARKIVEHFKENPTMIIEKWWNSTANGSETCSHCHNDAKKPRFCVTCGLQKKYLMMCRVPKDGIERDDAEEQEEWKRRQEEETRKSKKYLIVNEFLPKSNSWYDDKKMRPVFGCPFNVMANQLLCADCCFEHHEDHALRTSEQLMYIDADWNKSALKIVSDFIWYELRSRKSKCLIKTMRLHRTCEKLIHFVKCFYTYTEPSDRESHVKGRWRSDVNKYFESLSRKNVDSVSREYVDELIQSLSIQLKYLTYHDDCKCDDIWNQMHKISFGNQVEKLFVKVINELEDREIKDCPLTDMDKQNIQNKVEEVSKHQIFRIYTAFCWNYTEKGVFHLFDNNEHKPCVCPNCNISTCLECLKSNWLYKCSFCGEAFFEVGLGIVREFNEDVNILELVGLYKRNCVDFLEEWWRCEPSHLGFCLSCSSYSEELEICVFCEFLDKHKALKTKPKIENSIQMRQNLSLEFNYSGLNDFPIRWQCSDCKKRLHSNWVHSQCDSSIPEHWKGTWRRGCNHILTRILRSKCKCYDANADECEYNSITLKSIRNYEFAMKVATMGLIFRILKSGIEENITCKIKRGEMLNTYGLLKSKCRYFFINSMKEEINEEMNRLSNEINKELDNLKIQWKNYNGITI